MMTPSVPIPPAKSGLNEPEVKHALEQKQASLAEAQRQLQEASESGRKPLRTQIVKIESEIRVLTLRCSPECLPHAEPSSAEPSQAGSPGGRKSPEQLASHNVQLETHAQTLARQLKESEEEKMKLRQQIRLLSTNAQLQVQVEQMESKLQDEEEEKIALQQQVQALEQLVVQLPKSPSTSQPPSPTGTPLSSSAAAEIAAPPLVLLQQPEAKQRPQTASGISRSSMLGGGQLEQSSGTATEQQDISRQDEKQKRLDESRARMAARREKLKGRLKSDDGRPTTPGGRKSRLRGRADSDASASERERADSDFSDRSRPSGLESTDPPSLPPAAYTRRPGTAGAVSRRSLHVTSVTEMPEKFSPPPNLTPHDEVFQPVAEILELLDEAGPGYSVLEPAASPDQTREERMRAFISKVGASPAETAKSKQGSEIHGKSGFRPKPMSA